MSERSHNQFNSKINNKSIIGFYTVRTIYWQKQSKLMFLANCWKKKVSVAKTDGRTQTNVPRDQLLSISKWTRTITAGFTSCGDSQLERFDRLRKRVVAVNMTFGRHILWDTEFKKIFEFDWWKSVLYKHMVNYFRWFLEDKIEILSLDILYMFRLVQ